MTHKELGTSLGIVIGAGVWLLLSLELKTLLLGIGMLGVLGVIIILHNPGLYTLQRQAAIVVAGFGAFYHLWAEGLW